jgi:hypothetical protein
MPLPTTMISLAHAALVAQKANPSLAMCTAPLTSAASAEERALLLMANGGLRDYPGKRETGALHPARDLQAPLSSSSELPQGSPYSCASPLLEEKRAKRRVANLPVQRRQRVRQLAREAAKRRRDLQRQVLGENRVLETRTQELQAEFNLLHRQREELKRLVRQALIRQHVSAGRAAGQNTDASAY